MVYRLKFAGVVRVGVEGSDYSGTNSAPGEPSSIVPRLSETASTELLEACCSLKRASPRSREASLGAACRAYRGALHGAEQRGSAPLDTASN